MGCFLFFPFLFFFFFAFATTVRASNTDRELSVFRRCRRGRAAGTGYDESNNCMAVRKDRGVVAARRMPCGSVQPTGLMVIFSLYGLPCLSL